MAGLDSSLFAELARTSSHAVLAALDGYARSGNLDALQAFLQHSAQQGIPTLLSANRKVPVSADAEQANSPQRAVRFTGVLAVALAARGTSSGVQPPGWTTQHTALARHAIELLRTTENPQLLTDFAFDATRYIGSVEMLRMLLDAGVSPSATSQTLGHGCHPNQPLYREALLWGRVEAASFMLGGLEPTMAAGYAEIMATREQTSHLSGTHDSLDCLRLAQRAHLGAHAAVRLFLETLTSKVGWAIAREVRAGVLAGYFEVCARRRQPWRDIVLAAIFGVSSIGELPGSTLGRWLNAYRVGLGEGGRNALVALRGALRAHCAPVVDLSADALRDSVVAAPHAQAIQLSWLVDWDSMPIAGPEGAALEGHEERLRLTLAVLARQGVDLKRSLFLHALAHDARSHERTAKLPVLLDQGVDGELKNARGRTARTELKAEWRDEWMAIVRAHRTRHTASRLMHEV